MKVRRALLIRKLLGKSQRQVEADIKMDRGTLSKYERNLVNVGTQLLFRLARYYGFPAETLDQEVELKEEVPA